MSIAQIAEELLNKPKEDLSKDFDSEVEEFSKYLTSINDPRANDPLTKPERMLIKTFLIYLYKRQRSI